MAAQVEADREWRISGRVTELVLGLAISTITLLAGLLVAEGLFRYLAPVPDPYFTYKAEQDNGYIRLSVAPNLHLRTTAEEGLPGMTSSSKYTVNNVGFRGDSLIQPKPKDEIRVIMIGGSTTECLYLDDSVAINRVVERRLNADLAGRVKVYNAGVSGAAMDDHLSMLVHRVVHLEPDAVVVFAGINDLTRSIHHADPLHFTPPDSLIQRWKLPDYIRFAATEFQIPRRLYYLLKPLVPRSPTQILTEIPNHSAIAEQVRLAQSAPAASGPPRVDRGSYRRNLETLIGVARSHRIHLSLMTQQTTWNGHDPVVTRWQWMRYHDGVTYPEDAMDAALESLNDVMRQVAKEFGVPLYDLPAHMAKTSDFFYDDVHFNVRGAREAGGALATLMLGTLDDHILTIKR